MSNYTDIEKLGLTIISISLDDNQENWLNAMNKDEICWVSLWDKDGFKNRNNEHPYKIKGFPTTYLIDKKGEIVLENPSLKEILNYIKR